MDNQAQQATKLTENVENPLITPLIFNSNASDKSKYSKLRSNQKGFARIWLLHSREDAWTYINESDWEKTFQPIKDRWLRSGKLNQTYSVTVALRLASKRSKMRIAKVETLLISQMIEQDLGYVSSFKLRQFLTINQAQGIKALAVRGYAQTTGNRLKPYTLTSEGHALCAYYYKQLRELNNAIPLK